MPVPSTQRGDGGRVRRELRGRQRLEAARCAVDRPRLGRRAGRDERRFGPGVHHGHCLRLRPSVVAGRQDGGDGEGCQAPLHASTAAWVPPLPSPSQVLASDRATLRRKLLRPGFENDAIPPVVEGPGGFGPRRAGPAAAVGDAGRRTQLACTPVVRSSPLRRADWPGSWDEETRYCTVRNCRLQIGRC